MQETATISAQMSANKSGEISGTIKQYGRKLMQFIRPKVATEEQAEDILQDVWYQFSATLNMAPIEQVGAWLYKVARNKITDEYRRTKPLSLEDETETEDDEGEISFRALLQAENVTPETEYLRNIFWEQLYVALEELPEEQRQVFVLHELEDYSLQEIADLQNANLKTIISRKRYAVLHLRESLKELYDEIVNY
ncbi:MAG: RNA polymerase sigma factor [Sphingobacteriales bacterium]|nr:MAG: RNA polymerase sigma factor [Sphingobacteriales bacterium]